MPQEFFWRSQQDKHPPFNQIVRQAHQDKRDDWADFAFIDPGSPLPFNGYRTDRDRPLSFHWHAPELAELLGLPRARSHADEQVRASILAEAILGWECHQRVSYSRRAAFYSPGRRYRGMSFSYSRVMAAIADLHHAGLIIDYRAPPGNFGWQSSFEATATLIDLYLGNICGLVYRAGEIILLKCDAGELVDYVETRQTLRLRREMARINENLAGINIGIPGAEWRGQHLLIGKSYLLPTPTNAMKRIFSRGSFGLHGRAYGWFQSAPKAARAVMSINGERTAEVDYTALHASILYSQASIRHTGDPYDIDGFDRSEIKLGFNIVLNAKKERAAVAALALASGEDRGGIARRCNGQAA